MSVPAVATGSIRVISLPAIEGLALFETSRLTHSIPRQYYDKYVITLVNAGYGRIVYRGALREFATGSAFLLHPGEPLEGSCEHKSSLILQLDPATLHGRAPLQSRDGVTLDNPSVIAAVRRMFGAAWLECSQLERTAIVEQSLECIAGPDQTSHASRPQRREQLAVRRTREYIDSHFEREISLIELARVAKLHPSYLNRVFRQQLGLPPHEYQSVRRVRRASELVLAGHSLFAAASAVGFFDQSHLNRHFSRIFGFAPSVFTRTTRGMGKGRTR